MEAEANVLPQSGRMQKPTPRGYPHPGQLTSRTWVWAKIHGVVVIWNQIKSQFSKCSSRLQNWPNFSICVNLLKKNASLKNWFVLEKAWDPSFEFPDDVQTADHPTVCWAANPAGLSKRLVLITQWIIHLQCTQISRTWATHSRSLSS